MAEEKRSAMVLKRQAAFLSALRMAGTIKRAASKAKISREVVRLWRRDDPEFAKQFEEAELEVTGLLEDSAVEDALAGDVTTRIFLLKARNPAKYRDTTNLNLTSPVPLHITLSDDRGGDEPKPAT